MRVMPIMCHDNGYSKFNEPKSNNLVHNQVASYDQVAFRSGKTIIGGFIAGVVGTIAVSTVVPAAILGAGVVAIGGAILGDKIDDNDNKTKK